MSNLVDTLLHQAHKVWFLADKDLKNTTLEKAAPVGSFRHARCRPKSLWISANAKGDRLHGPMLTASPCSLGPGGNRHLQRIVHGRSSGDRKRWALRGAPEGTEPLGDGDKEKSGGSEVAPVEEFVPRGPLAQFGIDWDDIT